MPYKRHIDKSLYDYKPVRYVNGMPWPRLPTDFNTAGTVDVPLKEEYLLRSMDYLDTIEARPIFEKQADIIIKHGITGIVDVGCRIGILNDILQERNYTSYQYMGFDTSPQPIAYASEVWADFPNIEYRCASMFDLDKLAVTFNVDCVIWSGVLLYAPHNHLELFRDLTAKFYGSTHAIIQEPCRLQSADKFLPNLRLNTIEQDLDLYKEHYTCIDDCVVDANIFSGKRRIVHLCL
jgi:SAM-dependent methyltransferase